MIGTLWMYNILAIVQAAFLPGYLCLRLLGERPGRKSILQTLLFSFALSILLNHLMICLLTIRGHYTWQVMEIVIVWECAGLLGVSWRQPLAGPQLDQPTLLEEALASFRRLDPMQRGFAAAGVIVAILCLGWSGLAGPSAGLDAVFRDWDPVASWNRWAIDWAGNHAPFRTQHYPQVIPTTISIFYVLSGNTAVQFGAKLLMWLFPLGIFATLLELGIRQRRIEYFIAVVLCLAALAVIAPPEPGSGFADVPVSFMILMAVYAALLGAEQSDADSVRYYQIMGALFAGGALLTKQAGLYIIIVYPLLAWWVLPRPRARLDPRPWGRALILLGVSLAVALPWYVYKQMEIGSARDMTEVAGVVAANSGRGVLARAVHAAAMLRTNFGLVPLVTGMGMALLALAHRQWRAVLLLVALPGLIGWACYTSYDTRNGTFAIVLLSICAAVGLGVAATALEPAVNRLPRAAGRLVLPAALAAVVLLMATYPGLSNKAIEQRQDEARRKIFLPELNACLYRMHRQGELVGPVITNYQVMPALPELGKLAVLNWFEDCSQLDKVITDSKASHVVAYAWHLETEFPAFYRWMDHRLDEGLLTVVDRGGGYVVLEVHPASGAADLRQMPFVGFRAIGGLDVIEGPYPRMGLPRVRWGLGPRTRLEFYAEEAGKHSLILDCVRSALPGQNIRVVLNGQEVGTASVAEGGQFTFGLPARPGENQVDLVYSTWDTVTSPGRPMAVLYRALRIEPKR